MEGEVNKDEVLVIITRTDFDPFKDNEWKSIWQGYTQGGVFTGNPWGDFDDKEQEVRELITLLYEMGKIHQPRQYGAFPPGLEHYWLTVSVEPEEHKTNPALKQAWERYQTLAGLITKGSTTPGPIA